MMWVLYKEWTNCLHAHVYKCDRLQIAYMVKQLNGLSAYWDNIVKNKKPIEYIYGKIEAKELKKPSLLNGWSLETLPQIISLIRKYLFYIPYLARDNHSDNSYWHKGTRSWFSLLGRRILAVLIWL